MTSSVLLNGFPLNRPSTSHSTPVYHAFSVDFSRVQKYTDKFLWKENQTKNIHIIKISSILLAAFLPQSYRSIKSFLPLFQLSARMCRQVLTSLHEKVIPHMTSPILLADFLTQAYSIGEYMNLFHFTVLIKSTRKYTLHLLPHCDVQTVNFSKSQRE